MISQRSDMCIPVLWIISAFMSTMVTSSFALHKKPAMNYENLYPFHSRLVFELYQFQISHQSKRLVSENLLLLMISTGSAWHLAAGFQDLLMQVQPSSQYIRLYINPDLRIQDHEETAFNMVKYHSNLHTFALFMDDTEWLLNFFGIVCSMDSLKWTRLIHLTEWIVAAGQPITDLNLTLTELCVDHMTFVIAAVDKTIAVFRKSRGHIVERLVDFDTLCEPSVGRERLIAHILRDVTLPKKSSLDGLHIPVAILPNIAMFSPAVRSGNTTQYGGFSVALADVLASAMGFTYDLAMPSDGGNYGALQDDGTVTGLVGLLARREVPLCTMPMARMENRLRVIDFINIVAWEAPVYLTYRLPQKEGHLDWTLFNIVQPDFYYTLLGPMACFACIAGLTHILTRSCESAAPSACSRRQLRKMASCACHICFQLDSGRRYPGQTGRILRASWAIFVLIFSSAYSAYLVTTFTFTPEELKINTMEKLLEASNYRFGVRRVNTAYVLFFKHATRPEEQEAWNRMVDFNETDPTIFSSNLRKQLQNILQGDYAFIDYQSFHDLSVYREDVDYSDVRSYSVRSLKALSGFYVTLAQNAFFKDELFTVMSRLTYGGSLRFLQDKNTKWSESTMKKSSAFEEKQLVTLPRIAVFLYVTAGGVAAGIVVLTVEIVYMRMKAHRSLHVN